MFGLFQKKQTHWYVTYMFQDAGLNYGYKALVMATPQNWFPIATAREEIRKNEINPLASVLVLSWQKMSKQQVEEFSKKNEVL